MSWLFQNESEPVVAIIDENENQLFTTVGLMSLQINPSKSFSEHTLENGQVVTDNVINNRTMISVQLILDPSDYTDVYNDIRSVYESSTPISIISRVDIYTSMYIQSMPHEETPDKSNTVTIILDLIEQQIVETTTETLSASDVASPSDTSTAQSGQKATTESKTTLLDSIFGKFL